MEQTKAFLVKENGGMFMYSQPHKIFFSKNEANFYCWKKTKEEQETKRVRITPICYRSYYSVSEVAVESIIIDENSKEYKKFVAEQIEKIDKQIKEKEECAEKDTNAIQSLQKEKESFRPKKI